MAKSFSVQNAMVDSSRAALLERNLAISIDVSRNPIGYGVCGLFRVKVGDWNSW